MGKVLFISYHFPPSGGAKTRRTLKFLKYMIQYRCIPVVLTTRANTRFAFDPSLVDVVPPEVHVHRAYDLSLLFSWRGARSGKANLKSVNRVTNSVRSRLVTRLLRQYFSWLKKWASVLTVPDTFLVLWGSFAVLTGLGIIRSEGVAIIYSTGPPFSNHLVGVLLKKIMKKPLIVDFRDAWTADPLRRLKYPSARRPIESILEKIAIRSADLVISTTEGITQDFCKRYGHKAANKFTTITNGFDRDEFCLPNETQRDRRRKMRMVHTGHLRLERSPKPLLLALRRLFDDQPNLADDLEVYLIGENQPFLDGKYIADYLNELSLESVVKLIGHVPQPEAIQYQMSADILLLVIGVVPPEEISTYGIASKVFDYMIAGRPVLTLADPGPVSELVEKTQIGPTFAPSDIEGIKEYLSNAMEAFRQGQLEVKSNKQEIERYDFRQLTRRLVESFHDLMRT